MSKSLKTDLRAAGEALARVVAALADDCPVCPERRATHAKAQARFRKAAKARKARAATRIAACQTCKARRATDAVRQRKHRHALSVALDREALPALNPGRKMQ